MRENGHILPISKSVRKFCGPEKERRAQGLAVLTTDTVPEAVARLPL